jgi:hypothetical protein
MHALFRLISRWLLLVMLATVISPSFGWEMVPAMAGQEHAAMLEIDEHAGHDMSAAADQAAADCCAEPQHQCCLGHQLGHPQGSSFALFMPPSTATITMVFSERFFTRVPEGLERPPRSLSV